MWATNTLRDRLALAEYQSAIDPTKLISEQRIADAWNKYVREIGAPEEALVNIAEIHNLRDAFYVEAQLLWSRGSQSIWTMPDILRREFGWKTGRRLPDVRSSQGDLGYCEPVRESPGSS